MIKCRIYLFNDGYNKNIFVETVLPSIPAIGSEINLGSDLITDLENQVKKSWGDIEIQEAFEKWLIRNSIEDDSVILDSIDSLSFYTADTVVSICFTANSEIVEITIGKTGDWLIQLLNNLNKDQLNYAYYHIYKANKTEQ